MGGEDLLRSIFSNDVLARLGRVQRPDVSDWDTASLPVRRRHDVVRTTGPEPWRAGWAYKRAWTEYLVAADGCGLLADGELRSALAGDSDDAFRGAMAECLAAWLLTRKLGIEVVPKPESKVGKNADFLLKTGSGDSYAEVKAPHVPRQNQSWSGNDARTLRKCVESAGPQLKRGRRNVVLIVPLLRIEVFAARHQLVEALIGEHAFSIFIGLDPSVEPPPAQPTFLQKGKLARLHPKGDGSTSTDLTRIGAVASIEELIATDANAEPFLDHRVVVVHNPFAEIPVPAELFGDYPQLLKRVDGDMEWAGGGEGDDD